MAMYEPFLKHFLRLSPAIMLVACSTSGIKSGVKQEAQSGANSVAPQHTVLLETSQDKFEDLVRSVDVKSRLMDQYASWKGVHYRLGGDSKRGIDCSAFVQTTFRDQFGLSLPRSTFQQQNTGHPVQRAKLRPGDLVLFRFGPTGRHIGIYLGNNNFVHASSSSGVMISNLNEHYWKTHYRQARRILDGVQS